MKKILYLSLLTLLLISSSCSNKIYNVRELQGNYDIRMDNKEELEIKGKVRIFLSENDVKGEYMVISHNAYEPFVFPIFMSKQKEIRKKFYENAAKQAYKLGGNGIIITSDNSYKVISIYNWDSDNAESAGFTNLILDTELLEQFNNGTVAKSSPREVKRYVNDMMLEVQLNVKAVKTTNEVPFVENKLDALQNHNNSLTKADNKLEKFFNKNREELIKKAKSIFKKEGKILNTTLIDNFKSGRINQLKPNQVEICIEEFIKEIESNISSAKTSNDVSVVVEKINALKEWNNAQVKKDNDLTKTIEKLNQKQIKLAQKIAKKESKQVKK